MLYEASNLVNEQPIGRHPTVPDEGSYLCPNDVLLGRATSRVPAGPFKDETPRRRFEFIQKLTDTFWRKWTNNYFSALVVRKKWHTEKRNLRVGDVVMIKDANSVRGGWKLGKVNKVFPSDDGHVRRCQVSYKQQLPGTKIAPKFTTIDRPIQDFIVIVAADEDDD